MRQGVSGTAAKKLEHINVPELKSVNSALQIIQLPLTYLLKTGNGKDSQENSDFSLGRNNEDRISAKQFNILTDQQHRIKVNSSE